MSSNSQQSTLESTTSPNYADQPVTAEAVAAILNDAVQTNDSLAACFL